MEKSIEREKIVYGLAVSADAFNATPVSDAVNLSLYGKATLALIVTPGASTGTATVTVEACTAADGTGATAVAFESQFVDAEGSPVDGVSTRTARAAAGFNTTAQKDGVYLIHILPNAVDAVGKFVRVKLTEVVNDPVPGSAIWLLSNPRYSGQPSAIS